MKKSIFATIATALLLSACTKTFLDKKPDQSLVIPQTLQDFQALLDNSQYNNLNMPGLEEVSADDNYVTSTVFNSITVQYFKNAYTWQKDIYAGATGILDWTYPYQTIFYSNVVLEGLDKLSDAQKKSPQFAWEKGSALFFRAIALYQLEQLFGNPYNAATAASDLGVPIRTSSDINQVSTRATVGQTYAQVISDLQQSLTCLPETVSIKTRPNLAAANGLLARVYLSMSDYPNALKYSSAGLKENSSLLDYNKMSAADNNPFPLYNQEVIFHCIEYQTSFSNPSRLLVDSLLYQSYDQNDLRLQLFFKPAPGGNTYRGSYAGSSSLFNGIATDELYLIKAECEARLEDAASAMKDLNTLLATRWLTGTFVPLTAANAADATTVILKERRKELLFRSLRWTDLRRLNLESGRSVTLTRTTNGVKYTLPPNDPRYVLPIPDQVIQLSHIAQNPR